MGEPDDSICALILDMPSIYRASMLQAAKDLDLKEPRDLQDYTPEQVAHAASRILEPAFREALTHACTDYDVRLAESQTRRSTGWG